MSRSLPSKQAIVVDVPEVTQFLPPTFTYIFFTTDETSNETGNPPESLKRRPTEFFDDGTNIATFQKSLPRFVTLKFKPVILETDPDYVARQPNDLGLIRKNIDSIVLEDNFTNNEFLGVNFEPIDFDAKIYNFVSGSASASSTSTRTPVPISIFVATPAGSLATEAIKLSSITSEKVPPAFLKNAMAKPNIEGHIQKAHIFDEHEGLSLRIQFDTRLVADAIATSLFDPISSYNEDIQTLWDLARPIQAKSIAKSKSNILHHKEYDTEIRFISVKYGDETSFNDTRTTRIVGYIIDKWEIKRDGTFRNVSPPIVVENPKIGSFVDFSVKYGTEYAYAIRTIAEVKYVMPVQHSDGTVETALVTLLVSSKPTPKQYVKTFENIAPPPPVDLDFVWNYENHTLGITWSLPVNTQRDIKKFQVFRRVDVTDPFELLCLFDFNDSEFVYPDPENDFVTDNRRVKSINGSPTTFYIDEDFTRDSAFIYAVASVDAHGMTSGYSQQFRVVYDRFKNKILKTLVSPSGAPKTYPNFSIITDTFADVITGSLAKSFDLYFTPDATSVIDRKNSAAKIVQTDSSGGYYLLQLINTDIQKQHTIRIDIQDGRQIISPFAKSDLLGGIASFLQLKRDTTH